MTTVNLDRTPAELVADNPWRARVFEEFSVPFADSTDESLRTQCEQHGFDEEQIHRALIGIESRDTPGDPVQFANLTELVDYIEQHHHQLLRDELAPLTDAATNLREQISSEYSVLRIVCEQLEALTRDLPTHLQHEEEILFPAVRSTEDNASPDADPDPQAARELIIGLEEDHDHYESSLWQIRDVTDNYELPDEISGEFRARYKNLLDRLERLERDMQMHIHRENNILFRDFRRLSSD